MSRRPGLTLTEVLVTLAILAFGILAILTLFPLAASQMAIAVREDRSAQAANAADGYFRAYWKTEIVEKYPLTIAEPFYPLIDNPGGGLPAAIAGEPGYPIMIDPIGFASRPAATQIALGDGATTKLTRRSLALITAVGGTQYPFRVCSQMDGLGYDENGHPTTDRELRYNWAWLVQCPDVALKTTATLSVIVFDNRPNLYAPTGSEAVHTGTVTPGTTQITLSGSVNVKAGGWILDATDPTTNTAPTNKIRHAFPYQVVSVVDSGTVTTLELQTPLQKANDTGWTPPTYQGRFVVLRGVTGVYPRAPLTAN